MSEQLKLTARRIRLALRKLSSNCWSVRVHDYVIDVQVCPPDATGPFKFMDHRDDPSSKEELHRFFGGYRTLGFIPGSPIQVDETEIADRLERMARGEHVAPYHATYDRNFAEANYTANDDKD